MKFSEIVNQAVTLLQESQRVTYRALKREFNLDAEALEDLKSELIDGRRVATDEEGKVLVWRGGKGATAQPNNPPASSLAPASYTPAHLAERIRATEVPDGERKTISIRASPMPEGLVHFTP